MCRCLDSGCICSIGQISSWCCGRPGNHILSSHLLQWTMQDGAPFPCRRGACHPQHMHQVLPAHGGMAPRSITSSARLGCWLIILLQSFRGFIMNCVVCGACGIVVWHSVYTCLNLLSNDTSGSCQSCIYLVNPPSVCNREEDSQDSCTHE